MLKMARALNR